jgi:hypothetical protein
MISGRERTVQFGSGAVIDDDTLQSVSTSTEYALSKLEKSKVKVEESRLFQPQRCPIMDIYCEPLRHHRVIFDGSGGKRGDPIA